MQPSAKGKLEDTTLNFTEVAGKIKKLDLPLGTYALFGSVPMAAHGIRECRDIDVVASPELYNRLKTMRGWKEKALPDGTKSLVKDNVEIYPEWKWCREYQPDTQRLIDEAEIIDGIPVVKLEEVLMWKRASGREKDLKDIGLIERYLESTRRH